MCTANPTYPITLSDFTTFSSIKYNTLPEVEVASEILQQQHPNFTELLDKIFSLTKEYSIDLGVRLIHKHMQIEEGKVMIEKFQFHQKSPAFVTSADFPNDQIYPSSWLLEDDSKLLVFEYSTDPRVKHTFEKIIQVPSVFLEICKLIREYHLEDFFAPCITGRDSLKFFEIGNGFLEATCPETKVSILKRRPHDYNGKIVHALWAYPVDKYCFSGEYKKSNQDDSNAFGCSNCVSCSTCYTCSHCTFSC
ncbi:hypothetical protein RhiirA5_370219 [Rhizophagus irregularis]|uniref:Uncharacterized protein n=1 Tax=Rhizophagus irregularis TaxID=588596 RepID=A0A2I1F3W5_9GLOM|nr:hypothetical protein RhiirA5_370219 [Rhizophagus irregularis]PKC73796.1 hypothetical protein RhiirA1_388667 [Rhizophagus irregularis]PKY29071.1 hypothetical protein RhiirB3_391530 [Rhizophagus irregularis]CAB4492215.1 unnamed protein product [Rhizophagus irregularis]CAB5183343.1 unnamed protein product [Rhizophagus irregularis]